MRSSAALYIPLRNQTPRNPTTTTTETAMTEDEMSDAESLRRGGPRTGTGTETADKVEIRTG